LSRCSRQGNEEDEAQLKQQRDSPAHLGYVQIDQGSLFLLLLLMLLL